MKIQRIAGILFIFAALFAAGCVAAEGEVAQSGEESLPPEGDTSGTDDSDPNLPPEGDGSTIPGAPPMEDGGGEPGFPGAMPGCAPVSPDYIPFIEPEAGYCLVYPFDFEVRYDDSGMAAFYNMSPIGNSQPGEVMLTVTTMPAGGRDLKQIMEEIVTRAGYDVDDMVQDAAVGGMPAFIVEGLPNHPDREAYLVFEDTLYVIGMSPVEGELEMVWGTTLESFMPMPGMVGGMPPDSAMPVPPPDGVVSSDGAVIVHPVDPDVEGDFVVEPAIVEEIEMIMLLTYPAQINVIARGYLSDGCVRLYEAFSEGPTNNIFRVTITTARLSDEQIVCDQAITPFEQTIPLNVYGLPAGTYTVDVNGLIETFTFDEDNGDPAGVAPPGGSDGFPGYADSDSSSFDLIDNGVEGWVLTGPMCPVVREGEECPDQPYQATISILDEDGELVTQVVSDENGYFIAGLMPGTYTLHPETPEGGIAHAAEQVITFAAGQIVQVQITYDSGIR